jgi:hypothetical protein
MPVAELRFNGDAIRERLVKQERGFETRVVGAEPFRGVAGGEIKLDLCRQRGRIG